MTELICITCPKGCRLKIDDDFNVTGNACPRGAEYAQNELKNPKRVITSTVKTNSQDYPRCPVKTKGAIPKGKMFDVMKLLNHVTLSVPVCVGDIVIADVLGTGVDIVACKNINE